MKKRESKITTQACERLHDLANTQLRFQSIVNILAKNNHLHCFTYQELLQDGDKALDEMTRHWLELTKSFRI